MLQFQNLLDKCSGCDWGKGKIWNIYIWQPNFQSHQFCIITVRFRVPDGEKINMKLQIVTTCMCAHPPSMETTNLTTGAQPFHKSFPIKHDTRKAQLVQHSIQERK